MYQGQLNFFSDNNSSSPHPSFFLFGQLVLANLSSLPLINFGRLVHPSPFYSIHTFTTVIFTSVIICLAKNWVKYALSFNVCFIVCIYTDVQKRAYTLL